MRRFPGMRVGVAGLMAAMSVAAWSQTIESFESEAHPAVVPAGCEAERVKEQATDGEWSLKVRFPGQEEDRWPGLGVVPPKCAFGNTEILAFDVYNPQDGPVHLSYRVDSADGRKAFGGKTLAGRSSGKVELWLSSLANDIDIGNVTQFFPYIRMPREDRVLYFDHFRLENRMDRFKRLAYVEIAKPDEPTPEEQALGCYVFRRGELAHVFPNSAPWPGERPAGLTLFAAQGEVEPLGLSIRTLRDLDKIALSVSALTSGDAALPGQAVELGCVRHLDKKSTYSSQDYIASLPVYVEEGAAFEDLAAHMSRTFWVRFRVPSDAKPGLYTGKAVLGAQGPGGEGSMTLPVSLWVLPFSLPEVKDSLIGEYYRPRAYESDDEWKRAMTADLEDMRDHGMTSVGLCFGLDTAKVTVENGEVDLGFDGTTRFEHFMDTYVRLGFPAPIVMLADSGQGVAGKAGAFGSQEYGQAYKAFWQKVQATCRERGWPELIVQPVDEPAWQEQEAKDRNLALLKLLKEIPGMRTEQDGPGDGYFHNVAGPFADLWNYNGSIAAFDKVREFRKDHLVTFYNNDVESYRPEVDRYVAGFFQKAAGIDGVFNWEYRGGRGSLYDDLDGATGDWVHNYPATDASKGGPSVAWEAAREGVDDLKYLVLLEQALAAARKHPAAEQAVASAEKRIAYVLESLEAMPGIRGGAQWQARWSRDAAERFASDLDPEAVGFIGGLLRQPNGWGLRDYARARWCVALSILELKAACGEEVAVPRPPVSQGPGVALAGLTPFPGKARTAKKTASPGSAAIVPQLAKAPAVDGGLNDEAWRTAFRIKRFVPNTGLGDVEVQTEAMLGWHGEHLYIGIRCKEPLPQGLVADCMEDGESVWTDDCVEIFLDPGLSLAGSSQLVSNPKGVQWTRRADGFPWGARVPVETALGEQEWRVEAAVPLSEVAKGHADFGFNLCRERRAGGGLELSCWQPTGGVFDTPGKFARMRLDNAEALSLLPAKEEHLRIRRADALAFSTDTLAVEVEWTGDRSVLDEATLMLALLREDGAVGSARVPPPWAARARALLHVANLEPGAYQIEASVVASDGNVLESAKRSCLVIPAFPH